MALCRRLFRGIGGWVGTCGWLVGGGGVPATVSGRQRRPSGTCLWPVVSDAGTCVLAVVDDEHFHLLNKC